MRTACYAVSLFIILGVVNPSHAQQSPEKAASAFPVADGLKLELFASEPLFSNPTCMDVDEKGRVWVCESVNYRCHLHGKPLNRPEGDRIVILQDTRGDGKADKATTFYQAPDFLAPLGIAVSKDPVGPGYKVYVCHSPHIYVFEDKDGDGKAAGPPKILLTGFGGIDHDHGVHGIHFGPDGKLYFSVGDQGVKNLKDINGKVWNTNQTDCKAGTIWQLATPTEVTSNSSPTTSATSTNPPSTALAPCSSPITTTMAVMTIENLPCHVRRRLRLLAQK